MDQFNSFVRKQFLISFSFFILAIVFGILYSINLLGFEINSNILPTSNRSIHITLMLYGFIPLMLSLLPFLLIAKDNIMSQKGLKYLEVYFYFWYIFLLLATFVLFFGVNRGLAFYDFPYWLNYILAFSGVFYIISLIYFIKEYKKVPKWLKISLAIVIIAPITLLILMSPTIGQVEKTVTGPHGDNTLGMSFALIPIYFFIFKLLSENEFKSRWNIFWIIPLFFYFLSVAYRSFVDDLTYNQEWFCQYLTLLYIPLLYRWYKDADIKSNAKIYLLISVISFILIDIEGNILFIPDIRWVFHRNDLIVAHAHIAMGISILFMVLSIMSGYIKELNSKKLILTALFSLSLMIIVLSINGFVQAGIIDFSSELLWSFRTFFGIGVLVCIVLVALNSFVIDSKLKAYNALGFLGDGLGALMLFLFAADLYKILGFVFDERFSYLIFGFVLSNGLIHLIGLINKTYEQSAAYFVSLSRIIVGSVFIALFVKESLNIDAVFIGIYDLVFASVYFIFLKGAWHEKK